MKAPAMLTPRQKLHWYWIAAKWYLRELWCVYRGHKVKHLGLTSRDEPIFTCTRCRAFWTESV